MNVLLVQGGEVLRHSLMRRLSQCGYEPIATLHQTGVMEYLPVAQFLLLNPDGLGAEMGISLVNEVRRSEYSIPIVVMSRTHRWEDKAPFFSAGVDDYLTIPYVEDEVLARMESILRRYQKR